LNVPAVDWNNQFEESKGSFIADCQRALTAATTLRAASILLDQEAAWRDFSTRVVRLAQSGEWNTLQRDVATASGWWNLGRHLIDPFQVVLTGPPNVGKSALLNALLGFQRSVVFDQPGTTRDIVTAETAVDGWPVRLIDTAGLRENAIGLEAQGIELARAQLTSADLVLEVGDATVPREPIASVSPDVSSATIFVVNKIDLVPDQVSVSTQFPQAVAISARTGAGIEELIEVIARRLVPHAPEMGTLVPFREYQLRWLQELNIELERQSVAGVEAVVGQIRQTFETQSHREHGEMNEESSP
jgi:tRNA modification GTPase